MIWWLPWLAVPMLVLVVLWALPMLLPWLMFAAAVVALFLLAGCTSPEERRAAHRAECAALGFTPDTDPFRGCVLELRLAEEQRLQRLIQTQTYINSLP